MSRSNLFLLFTGLFLATVISVNAGTRVTGFGSNPGNLTMYRYIPAQLQNPAPLVVIMHGCTQSANGYESETGWAELAEQWGFALVSVEQPSSNNQNACFNWFENGDISRGSGEALSIKQMVDKMKTDYNIDANRVYVSGFSAGAAMTAAILAVYPDVFAGGAILAGVPYRCGLGLTNAFSCMSPGQDRSPSQWGANVRNATSHTGPWPIVSIWHGDSDFTVSSSNAGELVDQWTDVHGIDQSADIEDTIKGYPRKVYTDSSGNPLVESYTITGMGHAHPTDPGTGDDQGGSTGGFTQDRDIWACYYIGKFWGLDNSDNQPPSVSITSPSNGNSVSGIVTVTATASDNAAVDRVEFYVDGRLEFTDDSAPYSFAWDTTAEAEGDHLLIAKAYDTSNNQGCSETVTVNGGDIIDITPPTVSLTFPSAGDTIFGTVLLTAGASDDFGVVSVEFFVDGSSIGTGFQSGQAGPWAISWNTTSVTDGAHTIAVTAYDAKGNDASDTVSITVDQSAAAIAETFSDLDGDSDSLDADLTGWSTSGFSASSENHTIGPAGSGSVTGRASSGIGCAAGLNTQSLTLSNLDLDDNPQITYWRKLNLSASVNFATSASFKVIVDGVTVDEQSVTYANYSESDWTEKTIDLPSFANQTVDLTFQVQANSNVCLEVSAEAFIDDIALGNPDRPEDTTPPTVSITTPSNGATVSGAVDITATASDNESVEKVEFYLDGNLLGVDMSAPYSFTWNTSNTPDGAYQLMVKAYDAAGNSASDNSVSVTVDNSGGGGTPTTVTFNNTDNNDGYVKATTSGGSPATGSSFMENYYGLAIGHGSDGKFNRTILSFDTSSIPASATIQRAYITVDLNSSSGDPWSGGNTLVIDLNNGCIGSCTIGTGDWAETTSATAVSNLVRWTSGSQTSTDFNAAGLSAINKSGTTQLKLRFTADQSSTAYIFIDNGASASLTIEYQN